MKALINYGVYVMGTSLLFATFAVRSPDSFYREEREGAMMTTFDVRSIGIVESPLTAVHAAPRQADEGAPSAWLVLEPKFAEGLEGLRPGDEIVLVTWLDRASRDVLRNHPRGDPARPQQGVFTTRSPNRPNPIGLHQVQVTAIDGHRVQVRSLEAIHGTPILDIKGTLNPDIRRR